MQLQYFQKKRGIQEKKIKDLRLAVIPSVDLSMNVSPEKNYEEVDSVGQRARNHQYDNIFNDDTPPGINS